MLTLVIAVLAALAVIGIIVELVHRDRVGKRPVEKRPKVRRNSRRRPDLEDYVHSVLKGLKHGFGEVFVSYEVWKLERETRLNLTSAPAWRGLSELTRCQIIRQVWHALELVTGAAVVVVDSPPQRWSREIDLKFDHGPFGLAAAGGGFSGRASAPQYFKDT